MKAEIKSDIFTPAQIQEIIDWNARVLKDAEFVDHQISVDEFEKSYYNSMEGETVEVEIPWYDTKSGHTELWSLGVVGVDLPSHIIDDEEEA